MTSLSVEVPFPFSRCPHGPNDESNDAERLGFQELSAFGDLLPVALEVLGAHAQARRIGNPCIMDYPKDQPFCLVDWTSRVKFNVEGRYNFQGPSFLVSKIYLNFKGFFICFL